MIETNGILHAYPKKGSPSSKLQSSSAQIWKTDIHMHVVT
jgi:hypothetical protein